MALSVTSDLSVWPWGWVAKSSAQGRRLSMLFLGTRPQVSKNQSNVTQKSHTIILLLFALGTLELCWLPNVYFVNQNNLFIESWISLLWHVARAQNLHKNICLDNLILSAETSTANCRRNAVSVVCLQGCWSIIWFRPDWFGTHKMFSASKF